MKTLVLLLLLGACGVLAGRRLLRRVIVHDYEAGLLYRHGKFLDRVPAGMYWICPIWSELIVIDLRKRVTAVTGQEVLSADNVGLKVSLLMTHEVTDPEKARHEVQDFEQALHAAVQVALRDAVGSSPIDELLSHRAQIGAKLLESTAPRAKEMGIELHSVELRDVMFPGELKAIFAETVRAQKESQAALERARGQSAALRNLANAARMLEGNPELQTLWTLQTLARFGEKGGNSVIFGMPDGLAAVSGRKNGKRSESEEPQPQ